MTGYPDQPWSGRVDSSDGGTRTTPDDSAEPLTYQTVLRAGDGPLRPRRSAAERDAEAAASSDGETPRYRPRDYSPEGRRAVPSWAPGYSSDSPYAGPGERLDYHTLSRAELRAAVDREASDASAGPAEAAAPGGSAPGAAFGGAASASAASDASASGTSGSDASASGSEGEPPMTEPISTPEQPLTRRQLRALREAQEAAAGGAGTGVPTETAPVTTDSASATDRPEAPAAPEAESAAQAPAPVEETASESQAPESQALESQTPEPEPAAPAPEPVDEAPSWTGSAPATFAIPVIQDPSAGIAPLVEPAPAAHEQSLDEWVAQLYGSAPAPATEDSTAPETVEEQPAPAVSDPSVVVAPPQPAPQLVEPPAPVPAEPVDDAASLFPGLFLPTPVEEPEAAARPTPADPLAFLDDAPAAADRVDVPPPAGWGTPASEAPAPAEPTPAAVDAEPQAAEPEREEPEAVAPTVVGEPPVEPPGTRPDDVDAAPDSPVAPAEPLHPVVIDAEPLPAQPIAPVTGPVATGTTGHWAAQAAYDEPEGAYIAGREVGGGHGVVTTNALVLPSIPQTDLGPLSTTGEIVVTGSIDVPRSLSSTGAHSAQLDQSHLDHQLDPGDEQVVSLDSQPVRAIKAVSTHTSTRGMMTTSKSNGNRGLTVLIIVTAGLALVVAGVLIAGLVNHAF